MRFMPAGLQRFDVMQRMQWMLSVLAVVACLYSVASVHHHESGLHSQYDACISCDLEDLTSHGSLFSDTSVATESLAFIEPAASLAVVHVTTARNSVPIRAPPTLS